jgi:carboxyl-terminal processing protease
MYVDTEDVTPEGVYYGAVEGVLNSLDDPHSRLMKPDKYKEMKTEINQEFGGLGIYITIRDGWLTVIAPIAGTPAFKAGLKPGDIIAAINGDSTKDMTSADEAVEVLRGPKGSSVELTILRGNERFDVSVTRGKIPIKSVHSKMLVPDKKIGYMKITNFGEQTHQEVENHLKELHDKGMKSLVLDVRNNPGGSLKSAYNVADLWIEDGLIVYTRGRAPGQDQDYPSTAEGTESDYPIAILGNGGSASGSEILIGALKDHNRAVVMGDTTFGKGLVQSVFPLQDGSALALTTARYFTPDGHMIQGKGIPPQIAIEQTLPDTSVQRQIARLSRGDTVLSYVRENQPMDDAEINTLIDQLRNQGFSLDARYIKNQIRRQQLAMEGHTMVASLRTDPQLRKSLDYFRAMLGFESPVKPPEFESPPDWL